MTGLPEAAVMGCPTWQDWPAADSCPLPILLPAQGQPEDPECALPGLWDPPRLLTPQRPLGLQHCCPPPVGSSRSPVCPASARRWRCWFLVTLTPGLSSPAGTDPPGGGLLSLPCLEDSHVQGEIRALWELLAGPTQPPSHRSSARLLGPGLPPHRPCLPASLLTPQPSAVPSPPS